MRTNRLPWPEILFWIVFAAVAIGLVRHTWTYQPFVLRADIESLRSRLAALETAQKTKPAVSVQTMNIHVEKPQDAPKVAEGLLLHGLPGFVGKRLATARDLR